MTDEHYTDDDRLDARLRTGLAALVAEAPAPPPLPGPASRSGSTRRPLLLLGAVLIVAVCAVVAIVAVVATREDRQGVIAGTGEDLPLVDTTWVLEEVRVDGAVVDFPRRAPINLRITQCEPPSTTAPTTEHEFGDCTTGFELTASTVCNDVGADVTVVGDELRAGQSLSTLVGCPEPEYTLSSVIISDGTRFSITGERLRLERGGDVLVYRAADPGGVSRADLVGTHWVLTDARDADGTDVTSALGPLRVLFQDCEPTCRTSLQLVIGDDCGSFGAEIETLRGRIRITRAAVDTPTCAEGVLANFVSELMSDDPQLSLADGTLRVLGAGGRSIDLQETAPTGPFEGGTELDSGSTDGWDYRLSWEDLGDRMAIALQYRDPAGTVRSSRTSLRDSDDQLVDAGGVQPLGSSSYAYGLAPAAASTVRAVLPGGGSIDLQLHALDASGPQAYGGLVDDAPAAVVAYDAAGREIDREDEP